MSQLVLLRRSFLTGLASLLAAPAVVKADTLMKVSNIDHILYPIRGLIDCCPMSASMIIRIDRANIKLLVPKNIEYIMNQKEIDAFFTKHEQNMLLPDKNNPERQQKYMSKPFSSVEWLNKGLLPIS